MKNTKKKTRAVKQDNTTKQEPVKPTGTPLFLTYSEDRTGGQVCAGQEGEKWASHEDEHIHVEFNELLLEKPTDSRSYPHEVLGPEDVKEGDELYLTIVRYYDGGTFGRTCGYWHVHGVHKTAAEAAELAKTVHAKGSDRRSYDQYCPWIGYFAGLEGVEVHEFRVARHGNHDEWSEARALYRDHTYGR